MTGESVERIRVYELAHELDVGSKTIMRALTEMGEFVRSASTPLEPGVARALRRRLGAREAITDPFAPTASRPAGVAERCKPAAVAWAEQWFAPDEIRDWTGPGRLTLDDAALAARCRDTGLRPRDLTNRLDGRTVASRLRGGESIGSIAARLATS